jgi:hypothetical protein
MPVFIFLILVIAALLCILLSFLYVPIGKLAQRLWDDAAKAVSGDEQEQTEDKKTENEKENDQK